MISLISTVFVWSLSQNTLYNNTVTQTRQADLDRSNEKIVVLNTTYTPYNNSKVNVYAQIQNIGSSSVQFITVWLYMSNSTPWTNYNFSSLVNASVQGGSTFTLNVNLTATGVNPNSTYSISSWLITTRGNTVALQQTTVFANNVIVSQVTEGIGAIAMSFESFQYFNVSQVGSNYVMNNYPNGGASGYSTPAGNKVAFKINLTNYDTPAQRDIALSSGSILWVIFPVTGTQPRCAGWYIVDVYDNGTIKGTVSTITLKYGVEKTIFFASKQDVGSGFSPCSAQDWYEKNEGPSAANLMLFGIIGSSPSLSFGQNVPFVSIYFMP
jgi:hypothetical protein